MTAGVGNDGKILSVTYPDVLGQVLGEKLQKTVIVKNYGDPDGTAENTSYKQMQEACDIAILQYLYANLKKGEDPEGVLEANIDGLSNQGIRVYLVNYPYSNEAEDAVVLKQANQSISKAAKDKNLLLMDAQSKFQSLLQSGFTEDQLFSEDGVHLTEEGYRQLGTFLAQGLISDAGLE